MTLQLREASIETVIDNRYCRRHKLILELEARDSSPTSSSVSVYDISNTGLLIETNSSLLVGEMIEVGLPRVGFRMAEIVWTSGQLVGCKFTHALTQGAVSSARLEGSQNLERNKRTDQASAIEIASEDNEASVEKFNLGLTLRIVFGLGVLAWITVGVIILGITK